MARRNRIRHLLFFVTLLLCLSAIGLGMTLRAIRQNKLDWALAEAIKKDDPEQVKVALSQGANPNLRIPWGFQWVQLPYNRSLWEILSDILQRNRHIEDPAVYCAISWGSNMDCLNCGREISPQQAAMVRALIEAGADPNATTQEGHSVLMLVAESGDFPTLQYLIARGANVNAKTMNGHSATDTAKLMGNSRAIEIFRQAGAK